jgi:hypothetical protein
MLPFLIVSQVVLAGAALAGGALSEEYRPRALQVLSGLGAMAATGLFLVRKSGDSWSSFTVKPDQAAIAAIAILCAWLLVLATDEGRGRLELAALVGAASAGLAAFSLADWVAPALLFYLCLSAATLVATLRVGRLTAALWLALSDLLVVGALAGWAWSRETWALEGVLEGYHFYLVLAGLALRAGIVPRLGPWELQDASEVSLVPLVIGSGFALVPHLSSGDEIWVALPLLLLGLASAMWAIYDRPTVSLAAAWLIAAMLAIPWIAPAALGRAAAAAILASSGVALWRWSGGRAGAERGLFLAAVPLTAGFGAVVAGAAASFEHAVDAESVLSATPWSAFAALLPAALAAGVTLGTSLGRRIEAETFSAPAVVVTWVLAGITLLLGLSPGSALDLEGAGDRTFLFSAAAVGGILGARFLPRAVPLGEPAPTLVPTAPPWSPPQRFHLDWVAAAVVAAGFATALAFTYAGLKTGFL